MVKNGQQNKKAVLYHFLLLLLQCESILLSFLVQLGLRFVTFIEVFRTFRTLGATRFEEQAARNV